MAWGRVRAFRVWRGREAERGGGFYMERGGRAAVVPQR